MAVVPPEGGKISISNGTLQVPDNPVIPFIRGDGTGPDIWAASQRVLDAAVAQAYGDKRKIAWFEVYAGGLAKEKFDNWLPDDTVKAFREYLVGIKGPLTTPVGGGIRSLNVALRQMLDLYVCLRPVQYFNGVPSPVRHPEKVNMVIFRENTEDIYAGIEYAGGTPACERLCRVARADGHAGARTFIARDGRSRPSRSYASRTFRRGSARRDRGERARARSVRKDGHRRQSPRAERRGGGLRHKAV